MLFAAGELLQQIQPDTIVQLGGSNGTFQLRSDEKIANVRVGLEKHRGGKQDVINANDALFVQRHVVYERGATMQGEIQRVVQVVVQIRARADDEINQTAIHHLDHAAADASGRHGAGDGQSD